VRVGDNVVVVVCLLSTSTTRGEKGCDVEMGGRDAGYINQQRALLLRP
jgi:hypothetical protein